MPIYEYECAACKTRFERSQRFTDPPLTACPECGGSVRRVLYPAGIVFKGSGWYITDSRKSAPSETPSAASAPSGEGAAAGAKGDGATGTKATSETAGSTGTKSEAGTTGAQA
jgi:putative FmdB family regulatory protein